MNLIVSSWQSHPKGRSLFRLSHFWVDLQSKHVYRGYNQRWEVFLSQLLCSVDLCNIQIFHTPSGYGFGRFILVINKTKLIYIIENQDGCDIYENFECCTDIQYIRAVIKILSTLDHIHVIYMFTLRIRKASGSGGGSVIWKGNEKLEWQHSLVGQCEFFDHILWLKLWQK